MISLKILRGDRRFPTHKVEALRGNREEERGDVDGEYDGIEEGCSCVERASEGSEPELGRSEAVGRLGESEQSDEPICGDGWNTSGGDEGGESDVAGEDDAEDSRSKDEHHGDGVPGLPVFIDPSNPPRQRQDAIASHGENKTRRSDDRNASILRDKSQPSNRDSWSRSLTMINPKAAKMVMKMLAPRPRARA